MNRYAFSGGQDSIENHRKYGANLEVCHLFSPFILFGDLLQIIAPLHFYYSKQLIWEGILLAISQVSTVTFTQLLDWYSWLNFREHFFKTSWILSGCKICIWLSFHYWSLELTIWIIYPVLFTNSIFDMLPNLVEWSQVTISRAEKWRKDWCSWSL